MSEERIGVLAERLDRLERANQALGCECRRWRRGMGGAMIVMVVLGLAGANQVDRTPRLLEAQKFVLRDEAGRARATLGIRSDGTPGLALLDERSRVRLALDLCAEGAPGMNLYDKDGSLLAALAVRPDGSPGLGFFDNGGMIRLALDLGQKRTAPGLSLYDRAGTMRTAVAVRADDTPGIGLFDPSGRVFLSLDADSGGKTPAARAAAPAAAKR